MTGIQYITDAHGERTAVILPIDAYESMFGHLFEEVDDSELSAAMLEAENSPAVTREEVFRILESKS